MNTHEAIYGTDCGPECKACGRTIWTYRLLSDDGSGYCDVSAGCVGCHKVYTLTTHTFFGMEPTIQQIRELHSDHVRMWANTPRLMHSEVR